MEVAGCLDAVGVVAVVVADDVLLRQQPEVGADGSHCELLLVKAVGPDGVNHVSFGLGQGLDARVIDAEAAQQRLSQVHGERVNGRVSSHRIGLACEIAHQVVGQRQRQ